MRRFGSVRRVLALGGAMALLCTGLAYGTSVVIKGAAGPRFSVTIEPAAQAVVAGAGVSYAITMTPASGFSGNVTLKVTDDLPRGIKATVTPSTLTATTRTATLTLATTTSAPRGTFPIAVKATGLGGTRVLTASITIRSAPGLELAVSPPLASVAAGSSTTFSVALQRAGVPAAATLSVTGLPAGASATFSQNPLAGSSATMTVRTDGALTPDGLSTLSVQAVAGAFSATATTRLIIFTPLNAPFEVRGDVGALAPGIARSMNLALTNRFATRLLVTNLRVAIASVSAPNATPARPCTAADFSVTQFSGSYPLRLPAKSTRTLAALAVPETAWPRVTMLNTPVNQDGCKAATLTFAYGGSATR
jgi:hypothetical protein